jgi:hypothetical protein
MEKKSASHDDARGAFKRIAALAAAALLLSVSFPSFAQDAAASGDAMSADPGDDEIFGEEETVTQAVEGDSSIRDAFLKSEAPTITGTFTGSVGASASWADPWGSDFDLFAPDSSTFDPLSKIALGFSAKPETDLGFYGEVRTSYPFFRTVAADGQDVAIPDISVFKLYSKFSWKDAVFFSFGKQPLKWGQGYYFAPANDILSLSAIDFDNPNADREGPLSLKTQLPLFGSLMNAYLYLVAPEDADHILDVATAPKVEISLPNLEMALSGYFQWEDNPRAILSGSWTKSGFTAFGEGVLKFGSDRLFIVREERGAFDYRITERPDDVFFTGTAGLVYSNTWEKKLFLTAVAQYLYDGEAQENVTLDDLRLAIMERANPFYPEAATDPAFSPVTDVARLGTRLGRHYGAFSVNASSIMDTDLSASILLMANLYDGSGWVRPQLSYPVFKRINVSLWAMYNFGGPADEYTDPRGIAAVLQNPTAAAALAPPMSVGFTVSLGSGSF